MGDEVTIEVAGWPPQKGEAKSMLAAGHGKAEQVLALLTAAHMALPAGWTPLEGPVALHVVVRGPKRPPADATNYLGGIADVLQNKSRVLIDLSHLGPLAEVAVFVDDKQICQITYLEDVADQPSYTVRVRAAGAAAQPAPGSG